MTTMSVVAPLADVVGDRPPAATDPGRRPALVRRHRLAPRRRHRCMLFFALFPVWIVLIAAFSENGTLSGQTLLPESLTTKQYDDARRRLPVLELVRQLAHDQPRRRRSAPCCSRRLAAYAFSRLRFKGRRPGLFALLLIQMFPAVAGVRRHLHHGRQARRHVPGDRLRDRSSAIMLFYLGGALGANAWLIKGFFDTIPRDLDESAADRRGDAQPDVLQDHPAARRAGAGDHLPALVHRRRRPSS